ncbi:TetR family transcriptional regulator [Nocardioides humilatus]|uniref:TetR family transcriptional regulator n=1 Tax=Nocardioides humilatus TaxID=2607660 RepID=A0A5B1LLD8_9ACTN|nr:TetR/AcrR family transcriptional regulator [Nocardioides humilatus]KAA1420948.1 TetR family transcriptional regulator [Nocardioides humilatus]
MSARRHGPSAQARREALLRATVEVTAEQGVAGVTHRAVTERAGLPLATVSYFFSSIDELAGEALRTFMTEERETQAALAEGLVAAEMTTDEAGRAFALAAAPRLPETLALFEALLHAARHAELRAPVADALEAARSVASAGLTALGTPDPEMLAPAMTALAHGLALHRLAEPGCIDEEGTYRALRALLLGHLLDNGHEELALELAREAQPSSAATSAEE